MCVQVCASNREDAALLKFCKKLVEGSVSVYVRLPVWVASLDFVEVSREPNRCSC